MKIEERLSATPSFGTTKIVGLFEEADGRRFCVRCGKMIRIGQRCLKETHPMPFRRAHRTVFTHYPECPTEKEAKTSNDV